MAKITEWHPVALMSLSEASGAPTILTSHQEEGYRLLVALFCTFVIIKQINEYIIENKKNNHITLTNLLMKSEKFFICWLCRKLDVIYQRG